MIVSKTLKLVSNHGYVWPRWMISKGNHVKFARFVSLGDLYCRDHFFFLQCIVKKMARFGFCDIQSNQGPGKGYQHCKCCFIMKVFQFYVHSNNEFGAMVTLGSRLVQYSFQVLLQLKTTYRVQQKGLESLKSYSFAELYSCSWSSTLCKNIFGTCIYPLRMYRKVDSFS